MAFAAQDKEAKDKEAHVLIIVTGGDVTMQEFNNYPACANADQVIRLYIEPPQKVYGACYRKGADQLSTMAQQARKEIDAMLNALMTHSTMYSMKCRTKKKLNNI